MRFDELEIDDRIIRAVTEMGYEEATPIQAQAIPVVLSGRDVIGQAQTGTGKTAAFGIPMLQMVDPDLKKVQAVVLCPTRELAIQVADEIRKLMKFMHGVKVLPIYGGQDIVKQIRSLKSGIQVLVGTPGRVIDHIRRKTVKFDHVKMMILDEADEMLNMGFREDIETILEVFPEEKQTVLFSATMPQPIREIAAHYQKDAQLIKVVRKELTVKNIDQYYYEVTHKSKEEVLSRLLDMYNPKLSIVFCNTKKQVDELTTALKNRGYFAEGLHGDLKQQQRDRVMDGFRQGRVDILVATDVAARGIDVDDVDVVFNYDLPQDDEYYVHRIGRTGRAGKDGLALTFVVGREVFKLKEIQRYCKAKIIQKKVPSMNEVKNTKIENLMDAVDAMVAEEDLNSLIDMIEAHLFDTDYTSLEMAAALLRMHLGAMGEVEDPDYGEFGNTGAKDGMVRFFINIGKKQKAKPGDILGAIAGESGIPGKLVGTIDMYDNYTFVEVPEDRASDVFKAMKNAKIKGKSINMEPANSK